MAKITQPKKIRPNHKTVEDRSPIRDFINEEAERKRFPKAEQNLPDYMKETPTETTDNVAEVTDTVTDEWEYTSEEETSPTVSGDKELQEALEERMAELNEEQGFTP